MKTFFYVSLGNSPLLFATGKYVTKDQILSLSSVNNVVLLPKYMFFSQ